MGVAKATTTVWIERDEAQRIAGIERDRPRSGQPRKMTREPNERMIEKTVAESPPAEVATTGRRGS